MINKLKITEGVIREIQKLKETITFQVTETSEKVCFTKPSKNHKFGQEVVLVVNDKGDIKFPKSLKIDGKSSRDLYYIDTIPGEIFILKAYGMKHIYYVAVKIHEITVEVIPIIPYEIQNSEVNPVTYNLIPQFVKEHSYEKPIDYSNYGVEEAWGNYVNLIHFSKVDKTPGRIPKERLLVKWKEKEEELKV